MRERYQNPVLGDDLKLRLVSFNSNALADLNSVTKVEIYYLDPAKCSSTCPDGRVLISTIDGGEVTQEDVGRYELVITPAAPDYVVGKYQDVWYVVTGNGVAGEVTNKFEIYPDLWYFSTLPPVYTFDFNFQPNRIRQGSNKYIIIKVTPNVPRATDLEKYYTNLAISSVLRISMEKVCGPCPTDDREDDLRLVLDREQVELREKVFGYYKLDTREMDCGIYNVWFEIEFADVLEVSAKMQLQIF